MTVTEAAPAPIAWSYSRLHSYEDCPRQFYECEILKKWPREKSAHLELGEAIHKAMSATLQHGTPLPASFKVFQGWIDKVHRIDGELLVEEKCKFAITRDFQPTPWMSRKVWMRAIGDAVKLDGNSAQVVDWKSGKSVNADPLQLDLISLVLLATFPELLCVKADFVFLNEDHKITQKIYRHEMVDRWAEIIPRVRRFETAVQANDFPPKPGRLCTSWCPVATCEFHGK